MRNNLAEQDLTTIKGTAATAGIINCSLNTKWEQLKAQDKVNVKELQMRLKECRQRADMVESTGITALLAKKKPLLCNKLR